ncbi:MAG: CBS domain-containing protein [Sedimenticola sp.]
MKLEFDGIHHTAFATNDIDSTVKFWRDLIGLRLVYAYGSPGYRQYFFLISGNNRISFFEWDEVEPVKPRQHGDPVKGPFIFDHISIGVADKNALWELMGRLDGAGFHCSDVIDHGCFFSIYSYDPNGLPIEFSCDASHCDLFWNPVMKDQATTSDFLKQPNPIPGQWPPAEPIPEDERVIVPGEGKDLFPEAQETPTSDEPEEKHDCLSVGEIMSRHVRTAMPDDDIRAVAEIISEKKISGMPVVDDDNRLIGLISEQDILKTMLPEYTSYLQDPVKSIDFNEIENSYEDVLEKKVSELMATSVYSIKSDAPLMKAAAQMNLRQIRRIPVVGKNNRLVGIVSLSDIHQAIFKKKLKDTAN